MKLGKTTKNRLKIKKKKRKEKAEILAQENFQKRGKQLKRGTLMPLLVPHRVYTYLEEVFSGLFHMKLILPMQKVYC